MSTVRTRGWWYYLHNSEIECYIYSTDNVTKHNYNTTTLLSRYQHDPNPSNSRQVQRYHIPPSILHNLDMFSPSNLAKPLREKIERIENFFKYPLHPNYGAINLMNLIRSVKDSILEHKLQGHYQQFDSSPNLGEHDYPFSSRSVGVNGTRKVWFFLFEEST